jgi:hypothetical protein
MLFPPSLQRLAVVFQVLALNGHGIESLSKPSFFVNQRSEPGSDFPSDDLRR